MVDFQFLDNEEKLIAMKNSNTVILTYGNRGRLDMAETVQAGTAVLWTYRRGHTEWTYRRGVCRCPYVGGIE